MGRRPQYCSQACRQRAYRNRVAKKSVPCEILKRDLYSMEDRTARFKAAVKVLKELGYEVEVTLQKREGQQPKKPNPLKSV